MNRTYTGAESSKAMKAELKAKFPNSKFSVRYSSFSGGDSIDVNWTNGPTRAEVAEISDKYQYGKFNGMDDSYEYTQEVETNEAGQEFKFGGVKYVSNQRTISPSVYEAVREELRNKFAQRDDTDRELNSLLAATSFAGNAPQYTGMISTGVSCGDLAEMYLLDWTETIKGVEYHADIEGKKKALLEKEEHERMLYEEQKKKWEREAEDQKREVERVKELSKQFETVDAKVVTPFIDTAMFATYNSRNTLAMYKEEVDVKQDYSSDRIMVTDVVVVNEVLYDFMIDNLLHGFDCFNGKGGTESEYDSPTEYDGKSFFEIPQGEREKFLEQSYRLVVLVDCLSRDESFVVDPQGYNYARYVGLITNEQQAKYRKLDVEIV